MLDTIDIFQRSNPSTSLRDVRIVLCQTDTKTVEVMQEQFLRKLQLGVLQVFKVFYVAWSYQLSDVDCDMFIYPCTNTST